MNKQGPIVIIEDDPEDQGVLKLAFSEMELPNEIVFFEEGEDAMRYMKKPNVFPFLVISDINMPKLNGFELRDRVQAEPGLAHKCIPYVFLSTAVSKKAVDLAYSMCTQGYFVKPTGYSKLVSTLRNIVAYWQDCYSPARYAA